MSKPRKHGKKWQVRWFDETGRRRSEVHVNYKDAEYALKRHLADVEDIRRGFRLAPPRDRSFEELATRWLETKGAMRKSKKDAESVLHAHLKPAFGALTLTQITSERIAQFTAEKLAVRAPQTVKHSLALLRTMLRTAVEWGWLLNMPVIKVPKIRTNAKDYRWLRTKEEIDSFLRAAQEEEDAIVGKRKNGRKWTKAKIKIAPSIHVMYATAIHTGMRAGELAGLKWDDVDFERRLISVHRSFGGPTKAGDIRHVPIVDRLLPVLKRWRLACGSKLVFPNAAGKMWDQSGRVFQETLRAVLVRAGFDARYVHFHGLRHTFASHWVLNGGDIFRLQKILGHKESKMTQRYAHLSPAAFEADWGRFGGAPEDEEGRVVIELQEARN